MPEVRQNGSVELDRVSPESDSPDFFEIRVPNRSVPVRIDYAAIRELHRQLAGEGESIGLLVGSSYGDALAIQRCETLALWPGALGDPKLLPATFRQLFKARSLTAPEDATQLLGCFRTQVAGWPGLKDSDLEIAKRTFPGSDSFFILIRTTRQRPWLAALYALDGDAGAAPAEPVLEFPFDEYLLRNGYLTDLVQTPEHEDIQEPPKKKKTGWIIAAAISALLVAGSAAAYKFKLFGSASQVEDAAPAAPVSPALNLKVNRSGKDFEVSWDRLSISVQKAASGMLTIKDGALTRAVNLSGAQLREGRILYTPLFEELNFRLEVATPNMGTVAESVQVLAWSGKQPADLAPATPVVSTSPPVTPIAPSAPVKPAPARVVAPAKPISAPQRVAVIPPPPSSNPVPVPEVPTVRQTAPLLVSSSPAIPNTVVPPVAIQRIAPILPRSILPGNTSGTPRTISIRVMVDSAGSVQSSEVISWVPKGTFGEGVLKSAALDAANRWKFRPGQVNGKNAAAEYIIDFQFK